jgi:AhpD family alkylhydroperoxidase
MSRIAGVKTNKAGPLTRVILAVARRKTGQLTGRRTERMIEPLEVYAHRPRLLIGYGMMEDATAKLHRVDERLKLLAELKAATLTSCEYCVDIGSQIARRAGITQAYVFRIFGTKKALFIEVVTAAFGRMTDGLRAAARDLTGLDALALMGAQYNELLADRTSLLLQLQGLAACGDDEVREAVRGSFAGTWQTVREVTGFAP